MTTENSKSFNASGHLVQLKGKDYLEVKWRLVWLRTEHPNASIVTELVAREDAFALFRATVSIPGGGSATGYGSETVKDFGDFIEKAETKAIGRALGALGYGTQFADDFEMGTGETQKVVDSPVTRPQAAQQQQPTPLRAPSQPAQPQRPVNSQGAPRGDVTEKQLGMIYAIGTRELKWSDEEVDEYSVQAMGKRPSEFSKSEASAFIDKLRAPARM